MITFSYDCSGANWAQVRDIIAEVGWGERDPDDVKKTFEKSSFVVFAFEEDTLVGFGRTMDDGMYYALLVDVVVRPDHQRRGIGTKMVEHLKDRLEDYQFVTLTSAAGKEDFYRKMGWRRQTTAFMWPRDWQKTDYCE